MYTCTQVVWIFILILQTCTRILVQILFFRKLGNVVVMVFIPFTTHFLFLYFIITSDTSSSYSFLQLLIIIWIRPWKSENSISQTYSTHFRECRHGQSQQWRWQTILTTFVAYARCGQPKLSYDMKFPKVLLLAMSERSYEQNSQ